MQRGHVTPNGPWQVGQEKHGGRLVERHPGRGDDDVSGVADGLWSLLRWRAMVDVAVNGALRATVPSVGKH